MSSSKAKKKTAAAKPVVSAPKKPATVKSVAKPVAKTEMPKEVVAQPAPKPVSTEFKIEKGIPIPPRRRLIDGVAKYPLSTLEKDDSFFVASTIDKDLYASEKEGQKALIEDLNTIFRRMSSATRRYKKHNKDVQFSLSKQLEPAGVRVWRTE